MHKQHILSHSLSLSFFFLLAPVPQNSPKGSSCYLKSTKLLGAEGGLGFRVSKDAVAVEASSADHAQCGHCGCTRPWHTFLYCFGPGAVVRSSRPGSTSDLFGTSVNARSQKYRKRKTRTAEPRGFDRIVVEWRKMGILK